MEGNIRTDIMARGDLFKEAERPDESLFYSRDDAQDRRMGQAVSRDPIDYEGADIIILGSPQDMGVKRNKGRPGAKDAPDEIRKNLYKFPVPPGLRDKSLLDIGNIKIHSSLEKTHEIHYEAVKRILLDGKRIIVLGGGNDISYPDCRALAENSEDLTVFNIDSHFDVRESDTRHSGTPYRQLLDEKIIEPHNFYEMAGKMIANSPTYHEYLKELGVNIFTLPEVRRKGTAELFRSILGGSNSDSIFWGFDIDAVKATDAPGVSAPYPEGLTAEEINEIGKIAGGDNRSRIIEITEVNPEYDIDNRTSKLAAMIIMNYLWARPHTNG